jgi:hypothetical protein
LEGKIADIHPKGLSCQSPKTAGPFMTPQRLGQEAHQSPRAASQHRYANRYALVTEVATRRDVPLNKPSDQSKVSKTFPLFTWFSRFHQWFENGLEKFREGYRDLLRRFRLNRGTTAMKRYKIRRMAERLAVKIIRNLPLDRFEQELWHLAAIIEEHLFSELVQLDEAERRTEETLQAESAKYLAKYDRVLLANSIREKGLRNEYKIAGKGTPLVVYTKNRHSRRPGKTGG